MDQCPECGNEIADPASVCAECGHPTRDAVPLLPFDTRALDDLTSEETPPAVSAAAPAEEGVLRPPHAVPQPIAKARHALLMALGAVAVGSVIALALLRANNAPALTAAATANPSPASPPAVVHAERPAAPVQRWTAENRGMWLGAGNRGVVFEVAAENTVGVWMRNVRPALVVRCAGGRSEVFVFTQSPARIEPGTEDHTVTFSVDDGEETTERWPDSVDHDALFAPDGAALMTRLLGARSMRFGFTPHNAPPVVARFHVEGLDDLLRPSARECGRK